MEESQKDLDVKMINKHLDTLIEHFDSVQIFATRQSSHNDGTVHINIGRGNYFARYGQIKEWIIVEEESTRNKIRST